MPSYDELTLDHTPPQNVPDRSTERRAQAEAFLAQQRAQSTQQAAETREEMFNREASGDQVSPYLRDDAEQDHSEGDDDISF